MNTKCFERIVFGLPLLLSYISKDPIQYNVNIQCKGGCFSWRSFPLVRLPEFLLGALGGMYTAESLKNNQMKCEQSTADNCNDTKVVWVVDFLMLCTVLNFSSFIFGMRRWTLELPGGIPRETWLLMVTTIWFLMIIGLSLDGGRSVSSKILRTRLFGFLGKSSFHLYLMQFPTLIFLRYVFSVRKPSGAYLWSVFTLAPIFVAVVTRKIFDDPIQNQLK